MITSNRVALMIGAALTGAAFLCPLCDGGARAASAQGSGVVAQTPDTAIVRLHISRMTCGSCPATARLALKKLPGVYSATVTLDDSLGIVRYASRRLTPDQIAAHLTRLTGFGATVLP
ncbi:MAG TPA: heavy metal-associated domain-containing protein [Gemmatimonadales bacterium]|nr:heavy metal-associated domain-containing protein [Gemmatimonadales bacterium]